MKSMAVLILMAAQVTSIRPPRVPDVDEHDMSLQLVQDMKYISERTAETLAVPSCVDDPFGLLGPGGCIWAAAALTCDGSLGPKLPGVSTWMLCPATCGRCFCSDNPLVFSIGGCPRMSVLGCNRVLSDLGVNLTVGDLCPTSCGWCPGSSTPGTTPSPSLRDALLDIYTATNGAGWTRNTGWLSAGDPCAVPWEGVQCENGELVVLRLDSNNLVGTLPDSINQLSALRILDVSSNSLLTGTLPNIGNLTKLEHLIIAECGFHGNLPDLEHLNDVLTNFVFGEIEFPLGYPVLAVIAHVEPVGNSLEGDLDDLAKLRKLEVLNAAYNHLSGTISEEWCSHANIRIFDIINNEGVTGEIPDCFNQSKTLKKLSLSATGLTGTLPESMFAVGSPIEHYEISTVWGLTGTLPSNMGENKVLKTVYFDELRLTGTIPESVCGASNAIYLSFGTMFGLSGTIPEACGDMPSLQVFALYNLQVSGTIPQSFERLTKLTYLYFHDIELSGTLPDIFHSMNDLVGLYLNLNFDLHGTIPASAMNRPKMTTFAASTTGLSGQLPDFISPRMTFLGLANGNLSGTVPDTWCDAPVLDTLWLNANLGLSGTIPQCIGKMEKLGFLRLDNNSFSGSIPAGLVEISGLKDVRLMHNKLSGVPPDFSKLKKLRGVDMSHNPLGVDVNDVLVPASECPELIQLGCSGCGLTGAMLSTSFYISGKSGGGKFPLLQRFLMADNYLTGPLPPSITYSLFLITFFDVSGNNLTGTIPGILKEADGIIAERNPLMRGENGQLPFFITPSRLTKTYGDGTYECAIMQGVATDIIFKVDPSYYDYAHCKCSKTFWGVPPNCKPCIDNAICPGGDAILIPAGYYPSPETNPTHVLQCYDDAVDSNPCNSKNKIPWECDDGYSGRLCGRCESGFYSVGRRCAVCPADSGIIGLMVIIILLCLLILVAIKKWAKQQQLLDLLRLLVFFAQVQAVLLSGSSFLWPVTVKSSLGGPLQYAMVSPSILSCLAGLSWFSFEGSVTSIALVCGFWAVLLAMFLFGGWFMLRTHVLNIRRSRLGGYALQQTSSASLTTPVKFIEADPSAPDYPGILISVCKIAMLGTSFLYLPVTVACLAVFQCETDVSNGKRYMVYAPDTECSSSDHNYDLMYRVSLALIPTVVAGLPISLCIICYILRDPVKRRSVAYKQMFEFLHSMYKDDCYWYFVVAVLRRLLVAVAVSVVPKESKIGLPLLLVFLASFYAHHKAYMPLRVPLMNTLETYSLATMLATYVCGTLFSSNLTDTTFTTVLLSLTLWPYGLLYILLFVDLCAKGAGSTSLSRLMAAHSIFEAPIKFTQRVNEWVNDTTLERVVPFQPPSRRPSGNPQNEKECEMTADIEAP
eukprot:TRINITY_DN3290_c0_g1_i1.p1 TRINITY_DN3290_c0_g1~~TRINITY_DN3290_c0_g1_i1.p1  ORF type:complete len:1385 (+),score=172.73 TRINITY_DN3290_c0_g1_i1:42-4157(+)